MGDKKYICDDCGTAFVKWSGKCGQCGKWDSLQPQIVNSNSDYVSTLSFSKISDQIKCNDRRIVTNISELDRVLGGGLVVGSVTLIGGDPGIGKSTILLQLVNQLQDVTSAYVSGEESVAQISMRAKRMEASNDNVHLLSVTNIKEITVTVVQHKIELLVVDSIQTMYVDDLPASPGTVSQVRLATQMLINIAKKHDITVFIVGHVTKDGQIAGPKLLEHMVDTVLYFEHDVGNSFRIIRTVKNRFGAVNEIGVFEMSKQGLLNVSNPSALFLSSCKEDASGSAIFAGIEGTRPIIIELQALVVQSYMNIPRRSVVGWDNNRLAMIVAVLAKHCKLKLMDKEIYLNVVSGIKITEPAADLAVAAALISAISNCIIGSTTIFFGEIGLSGEVRAVSQIESRLKECHKLGFTTAVVPVFGNNINCNGKLQLIHVKSVQDLKELCISPDTCKKRRVSV